MFKFKYNYINYNIRNGIDIGKNIGELFKIHPELSKKNSIPIPMEAGSCSFHNGYTAHGAGANMTPKIRRAMTCGFMPEGSKFNGIQNSFKSD